jgi:hypothetical protein
MTRRIVLGLCLVGLLACDTGDSRRAPIIPTPVEPSLSGFTISGPNPMQPGESAQFVATARMSDGTSREVTANAIWRSSDTAVLSVTGTGLVTPLAIGESTITAVYQNRSASLFAVSLPAGTGILTGTVKEGAFPVGGVTVEVVDGPMAGRSTVTGLSGFYRIYGVVGDFQVRARKDGYQAVTRQVTVAPFSVPRRDQILNFDMSASSPALALAGNYRVSLAASGGCSSRLRADAMAREYSATVSQEGSVFTVVLSGAEFGLNSARETLNRFEGVVRPGSVEMALGQAYYYSYYESWGFVERLLQPPAGPWGLSDSSYLAVIGTARGPATQSSMTATLEGILAIYDAPNGFGGGQRRQVNFCNAGDHRLTLTRR